MTMRAMVKTMREGRIDFDPKTRRIIALRSGYRCAHPECDGRTTVGPGKQPDKYEDSGRASHIFAASKRRTYSRSHIRNRAVRTRFR
jgi:hypothetical protein